MSQQTGSSSHRIVIAAVVSGIFVVIAACVTGVFLLANTLLERGFVITPPGVSGPGIQVGNPPVQPTATIPQPMVIASATPAPQATIECHEEQFGPWGYYDELPIKVFPRDSHYVVSLWWRGRLAFTESAAIQRVNSPSGLGDTEIIFVVPPTIEEIRFRGPAGGTAWRLCNRSLAQAQADADAHADRLNVGKPNVQYWRINLPDGLSDPSVRKLVSCMTPSAQGLPECR